ncbi:zinc finger protein [Trifolium repens]|nr:zinc finger protein [Trifolium repens]
MIMNKTSTFSSSPHFHHQQCSVIQNENNKTPTNNADQPNNIINNFLSSKNNLVLQQPKTNNNQTQGRILKITFFMSSARNDNNNNNVVVVDDDHGVKQQNMKSFSCNVCNKPFSSNKALNGHMRSHKHNQKVLKKCTTTASSDSSSSSLLLELEQNKKRNHHDQDHDQLPPAIDLSNYLPPITYKTNKRRNRFFNDDDARNAAQALLDMSRGKFLNFDDDDDVNNRDCKRIKLSNE